MANPTESQWRASPAFNYQFESLVDCVAAAVKHFLRRPGCVFVILFSTRGLSWYIMPWSQYRHINVDHPATSAAIVFKGTYHQLRSLAMSFPCDLFAEVPPDQDDPFAAETAPAPGAAIRKPTEPLDIRMERAKKALRDLDEEAKAIAEADSKDPDKEPEA